LHFITGVDSEQWTVDVSSGRKAEVTVACRRVAWDDARMVERFPLSTLLSQALVAFTIEIDNEAELRQPHWITAGGRDVGNPRDAWLTSMAMYLNCVRWLPEEGLTVRELERRARTNTNLDGMRRWGYATVAPDGNDSRAESPKRDWVVRPTAAGRVAQQIWRPLFGVIEERWRERFGGLEVDALRGALAAVVDDLDPGLPDCMPILGYGLVCKGPDAKIGPPVAMDEPITLPALLARVLLAFALEFERESRLSLAICANVLRVLDEAGVKLRDVPERSGVSKESTAMAMGILRKWKLVVVAKEGSWQVVRLTALGSEVRRGCEGGLMRLEARWVERFGDSVGRVRAALEPIVGDGTAEGSPLFQGLEPYPDGWRAMVRRPKVLPHFPMVLHRGGYPDGS
jgi:hypothetical protein